jgi:DNA-binding NarL/FixJ family response regulator
MAGLPTSQIAALTLSPRLRQTLAHLLEGKREKQVAVELGLSPSTVHEYVRALYRHFSVSNRAELSARFLTLAWHMRAARDGDRRAVLGPAHLETEP